MPLPTAFVQQMRDLLKADYNSFEQALQETTPTSIRLNPYKPSAGLNAVENVLWNEQGYYLPKRPVFTLDPAFHGGTYYVQEASSMFLAAVAWQQLDFTQSLKILDLCAAPGGKSTLLLSLLNDQSLLVANEVIRSRFHILSENLQKWGRSNVVVSNHDPADFKKLAGFFDLVLVDAPCSGEGLFRKEQKARSEWSMDHVELCAARQKRILAAAEQLVAPEGLLIYCTCTYNETENSQNVKWLEANFDLAEQFITLDQAWNVQRMQKGYQLFPHQVKGEGFFISALKKGATTKGYKAAKTTQLTKISKGEKVNFQHLLSDPNRFCYFKGQAEQVYAFPKATLADYEQIQAALPKQHPILAVGKQKGKNFTPAPALALSTAINTAIPTVQLEQQPALRYLKREVFDTAKFGEGWQLVQYQHINLGWAKGLKNRVNNYYPKEWRIRMAIE